MNTLQAAFLAGANVCWQSAGWLEGGLVTSFEKFAADCEILDLLLHQFTPAEVDDAEPGATARTSRSATAGTSSARSTRSSASATASGGRPSRRRRTTTAGRRTDRWSTRHGRRVRWKRAARDLRGAAARRRDRGGAPRVRRAARGRARRPRPGARAVSVNPGTAALARGLEVLSALADDPTRRATGSESLSCPSSSAATRASSRARCRRSRSTDSSSAIPDTLAYRLGCAPVRPRGSRRRVAAARGGAAGAARHSCASWARACTSRCGRATRC